VSDPVCYLHLLDEEGRMPEPGVISIQRAYDREFAPARKRVLVDRIWPRGLSKAELQLDTWAREVAPSSVLRKWFGHNPSRWNEFQRRYRTELDSPGCEAKLVELDEMGCEAPILLLFGARDREHNQAVVLRQVLEERLKSSCQSDSDRSTGARGGKPWA
jgi:uncharacterized protein YeaO (DUF488 family)